ncbi:MAG: MBL fold metallo-hydrolase, partial [Bacteroidota bacterium]
LPHCNPVMHRRSLIPFLSIFAIIVFLISGCSSMVARFMAKSIEQVGRPVAPAPKRIEHPVLLDVDLAVLWVGHATVLVQIHDKVFLTDPLFTNTVGMVMKRTIQPGLDPASIPRVDFTLISHTHFDHFSFGSLDLIPKEGKLLLPLGALVYTPALGFEEIREMKPWEVLEQDGVTITAVPVQHFSGRYGFDILWMRDRGYSGYIIEYQGMTVFFGGDTGYHPDLFKDIGRKFEIDLAILPIGPVEPRDFMQQNHVDPAEALQIFRDLRARQLLPMHHRTLIQGFDPSPTFALEQLLSLAERDTLLDRIIPLDIGEQWIFSDRRPRGITPP